MKSCDVVVIGAGVAGCTLAYELARAGLSVVVAERGAVGSGSSAVNAGGIRQQFSHETSVRAGMATVRRLGTFAEEFGVDPGFRQAGYLFLHAGGQHEHVLARAMAVQNACGVPTRRVGLDEIAEMVPGVDAGDLVGGVFNPTDGYADPSTIVAGYASGARRLGAVVLQGSPVTAGKVVGGRVTGVEAGGERIAADLVVNAAGAWAPGIARLFGDDLPITARRNDVFVLDQTPAPGRFLPLTIDLVTGFYMHSEGDGLLAGPAESFVFDGPPPVVAADWDVLPMLVERVMHRVPALAGAGVSHAWAGFVEATPDDNPIVGWTGLQNLYTFAGFSGHGMCLAPGLAASAAQELCGERPELALDIYRLDRFASGGVESEGLWGGTGISAGTAAWRSGEGA